MATPAPAPAPDTPRPEAKAETETKAKAAAEDEDAALLAAARRRRLREQRLRFPALYVVVGAYRLCTDAHLSAPVWDKCRHGLARGMCVGALWGVTTFKIQMFFVDAFLKNSPRVTGLSADAIFGYRLPFSVTTYASALFLAAQITAILEFFLARNLRVARDRAWGYTLRSRGKGPGFWAPYVEEWARPPLGAAKRGRTGWLGRWEGWVGGYVLRRVILIPFSFYPIIGIGISAYIKALSTARHLHKSYFDAKKMTPAQVAVFMEERKWCYRAFGFSAALLEGLPIVGLAFTISNRVGAAMWAHDLEKRQHAVAAGDVPLRAATLPEMEPVALGGGGGMAGGWDGDLYFKRG